MQVLHRGPDVPVTLPLLNRHHINSIRRHVGGAGRGDGSGAAWHAIESRVDIAGSQGLVFTGKEDMGVLDVSG